MRCKLLPPFYYTPPKHQNLGKRERKAVFTFDDDDIKAKSQNIQAKTSVAFGFASATSVETWRAEMTSLYHDFAGFNSFLGAHSMGQTLEFDDSIMVLGVFSNALYIDYISFYASKWYPNGA